MKRSRKAPALRAAPEMSSNASSTTGTTINQFTIRKFTALPIIATPSGGAAKGPPASEIHGCLSWRLLGFKARHRGQPGAIVYNLAIHLCSVALFL
jgi:hypothetical protein